MDKAAFVHRRKKRYMAQGLEGIEAIIEGKLNPEDAEAVKAIVRQKLHALALDACEIISLAPGEELNGAMVELRDRLHIEGRPTTPRSTPA